MPNYTDAVVSVLPTTIGCSDGEASVKPVQQKLYLLVQFVAAIIWILEIYSIYGFPLYFVISTTDWICHLDGGLDMASRR